MRELYPVQKTHASILKQILERLNAALDGSQTGCGKTLIAAQIAAELNRPVLVVCPKSSITMWERELKDREVAGEVTNYEKLRTGKTKWGKWGSGKVWLWTLPKTAFLIFDEVQRCQGMNTQNARMLWTAKPYMTLCLSATAAEDPLDMKALGYILGLHSLKSFWSWAKMQGCKPGFFGGLEFDGKPEHMDALHRKVFPAHGSRLTTGDLRDHFQETQIITTPIDFGKEMAEVYSDMATELATLERIKKSDSSGSEALTIRLRARQKAELLKVPVILEMTEDFLKEGRSIAIFVNYTATLEALRTRLEPTHRVGMISGAYVEKRQEYMDDFQADNIRIMLCNIQAGGVSVNLHDTHGKHPRVSIISPSDNAKEILQCVGRIHRAGGKTPSQQHIVFSANTIEEEVRKNCEGKIQSITIFNEGMENSIDLSDEICDNKKTVENTNLGGDAACAPSMTQPKSTTQPEMKSGEAAPTVQPAGATHATYPPSMLHNIELCPGFRNRKRDETNEGDAAAKGTRIHKALEKDSIDDLKDEAEKTTAQILKDYIDAVIQENLPTLPSIDRREVRLKMDLGGDLTTFGTCDRLMIYEKADRPNGPAVSAKAKMFDYKTGYHEVADAEENAQAWCYVLGTFQKYDYLDEIEFTFLVPQRDEVLSHTFYRKDMPDIRLRLNTIIRRAMAIDWSQSVDESKLNPQPSLCEYCAYQGICPALARKVLTIGTKILPGLPVPTSMLVDKTRPDDIPKILRLAPLLEEWAKTARSAALKLNMEEGVDIAGFSRIERSTPRAVTSVWGAYEAVKDVVPLDEFLAVCSKVSVPKLEQFFADQAKRSGKGKARQDCENRLRHADVLRDAGSIFYLKEKK